jgi:hypothetical protein
MTNECLVMFYELQTWADLGKQFSIYVHVADHILVHPIALLTMLGSTSNQKRLNIG